MDSLVTARLLALNYEFYQKFGEVFSQTRQRLPPGVQRLLQRLKGEEAILDLGCGNGLLARALAERRHRGPYVGIDFSMPLLARHGDLPNHFLFLQADLAGEGWESQARTALTRLTGLSDPAFSLITAFAVLHHVPSEGLRLQVLRKAAALLAPDGLFFHSEWQFLNSPKLAARQQPWQRIGLTADQVEPGDYLLDWRAGGEGLRYVHHFHEAELQALAEASHFVVLETFYSDGHNGRLGLYQVWGKIASPTPAP